jgi:hypothetical protein
MERSRSEGEVKEKETQEKGNMKSTLKDFLLLVLLPCNIRLCVPENHFFFEPSFLLFLFLAP